MNLKSSIEDVDHAPQEGDLFENDLLYGTIHTQLPEGVDDGYYQISIDILVSETYCSSYPH